MVLDYKNQVCSKCFLKMERVRQTSKPVCQLCQKTNQRNLYKLWKERQKN